MNTMKTLFVVTIVLIFSILVAACGANQENEIAVIVALTQTAMATEAPAQVSYITGVAQTQSPPTPPMKIYALDSATGKWFSTTTPQSDGPAAFTLEVAPGNYQLFSSLGMGYATTDGWALANIAVTAGQTVSGIIVSPPGQSECGSMFGVPAAPDGSFAAIPGPSEECKAAVMAGGQLSPLTDNCSELKTAMEPALQLMISVENVPIETSGTGETGSACQMTALANGNNFASIFAPMDTLKAMLQSRGWSEVMYTPCLGHGGAGTGADQACFSNENKICEVFVMLEPIDKNLCPTDKPIGECLAALTPIQQLYTIRLTCAEGSTGMSVPETQTEPGGWVTPKVAPFSDQYMQVILATGQPMMLPPEFPVETGLPEIVPYQAAEFRGGEYEFSLDYGENCFGAGACHYGIFAGGNVYDVVPVGTVNIPFDILNAEQVSLANGITGYFVDYVCGANCGDATIWWVYGGYQYMLGLKAGPRETVIALANAAITNSIP